MNPPEKKFVPSVVLFWVANQGGQIEEAETSEPHFDVAIFFPLHTIFIYGMNSIMSLHQRKINKSKQFKVSFAGKNYYQEAHPRKKQKSAKQRLKIKEISLNY